MSKNWRMLTGLLFLGSVGTLQAHPLDLPDIVYIDGLPCNSACQSYMAWSRQKRSSTAEQPGPEKPARRSPYGAVRRQTPSFLPGFCGVFDRSGNRTHALTPAARAGMHGVLIIKS